MISHERMRKPESRLKLTRRSKIIMTIGSVVFALSAGYLDPYYFINGH